MREFAKISPQFWINEDGKRIKRLGANAQLIAFYLFTNPHANMIGIYYLPITFISHETGISIEESMKSLQSLCNNNFCTYDEESEYIWVHEMAFNQIGTQLKASDNRVKAIHDIYLSLPDIPFLEAFFIKYAEAFLLPSSFKLPSKVLQSKDKENDNDNEKEKEEKEKTFMSGKPDVQYLKNKILVSRAKQNLINEQALEVLEFLNEKTGRIYQPVDCNLKLIAARLKSGATVLECRQVIAKKTREWEGNEKMSEFLRPATLFNETKFEQYRGELVIPKEENSSDTN